MPLRNIGEYHAYCWVSESPDDSSGRRDLQYTPKQSRSIHQSYIEKRHVSDRLVEVKRELTVSWIFGRVWDFDLGGRGAAHRYHKEMGSRRPIATVRQTNCSRLGEPTRVS